MSGDQKDSTEAQSPEEKGKRVARKKGASDAYRPKRLRVPLYPGGVVDRRRQHATASLARTSAGSGDPVSHRSAWTDA
jgi:hypothetical protein